MPDPRRTRRLARTALLVALVALAPPLDAQRAPAISATPALHLGLLGRLENPPPQSQLATGPGLLLTSGHSPRHLVSYDPATLRPLRDLSAPPGSSRWLLQSSDSLLVGTRMLGANEGSVLALDATDGRELFRTPIAPREETLFWTRAVSLERAGVWVAASYHFLRGPGDEAPAGPMHYELLALRVADGALLWRAPADHSTSLTSDDSRVFSLDAAGVLAARDALSGAARWSVPLRRNPASPRCPTPASVMAHQGRVVAGCGNGSALVFDAATGTELAPLALATAGFVRPLAAWDGGVVLSVRESSGRGRSARTWLVGAALSPPRVLWTGPALRSTGSEQRAVAVAGNVLFHCGEAGTLEAVSLAQGASVWRWGVGHCEALVTTGAGPTLRLFASLGEGVAVFAAGTTEPPIEAARVEGAVTFESAPWAGAEVRVDNQIATTDAQGRYAVTAWGHGTLTVEVLSPLPPSAPAGNDMLFGSRAEVVLDGRHGPYAVPLATSAGRIDFHGPHPGH